MSATNDTAPLAGNSTNATQLDALIIGAGIAGMYQLYRLLEQGLAVRALEAGDNLGGTWYWNRYPGARVDSQSHVYQYWFSRELNDEWNWSQRFPAQPEVERYLNHVAGRFALRKDIQFNTRLTAATYNEAAKHWSIHHRKRRGAAGSIPHQLRRYALLSLVRWSSRAGSFTPPAGPRSPSISPASGLA